MSPSRSGARGVSPAPSYMELHKSHAEMLVNSYCLPIMMTSSQRDGHKVLAASGREIPSLFRRLMEPLPTLQRRGSFLLSASSSEDQNGSTTPLDSGASDRDSHPAPLFVSCSLTHTHTHSPTADTLIRTLDAMTYGSPCERLSLPSTDLAVNQRRMPATGGFHHHHGKVFAS